MDRVNVITVTTAKSPARQQAVGMWLVEKIHDGVPDTKYGILTRNSISRQELTLQLLGNAIYLLKKSNLEFDSIAIYPDEPVVESAFENNWIKQWQENHWKNAKGEEVKNAETWKILITQLNECGKNFIVMRDKSSYTNWMLNRCIQIKKKIENGETVDTKVKDWRL